MTVAATPAGVPAGAQALVAAPPPPVSSAAPASGTQRTEIKVGMTADEVRRILGDPQAEMVFGEKTRWTYPALTVVFVNGKVDGRAVLVAGSATSFGPRPSSASFAAMSAPAVSTFTSLSMKRTLPSLPM